MPNRVREYELLESLGKGGMGEVFKARNVIVPDDIVAIKIIRSDLLHHPEMRLRFLREAGVLLKLDHPNIMKYRHMFQEQGQLFLVMEFLEGVRFDEELQKQRRVQYQEGLGWLRQIVSAVSYAHRKGVLHRDLKPENIVIMKDGSLRIYDFGLAKQLGAGSGGVTASTQILGTPPYLPPEVVLGETTTKDVGPEADIYAMGVIAYRIFSGRLPYGVDENESSFKLLSKLMRIYIEGGAIEPLSKYRDDLPAEFVQAVMAALERKPALRPNDASNWLKLPDDPALSKKGEHRAIHDAIPEVKRLTGVVPAVPSVEEKPEPVPQAPPRPEQTAPKLEKKPEMAAPPARQAEPPRPARATPVEKVPAKKGLTPLPPTIDLAIEDLPKKGVPHVDVRQKEQEAKPIAPAPAPLSTVEDGPLEGELEDTLLQQYAAFFSKIKWLVAGVAGVIVLVAVLFATSLWRGSDIKKATLNVTTVPADALILLDGLVVAKTSPYSKKDILPGSHRLEVQREGFDSYQETLPVKPGDLLYKTVLLKALKGGLSADSTPQGALVLLDGISKGRTPVEIPDLEPGREYALKWRLQGFKEREEKVKVAAGPVKKFNPALEPEASPPGPSKGKRDTPKAPVKEPAAKGPKEEPKPPKVPTGGSSGAQEVKKGETPAPPKAPASGTLTGYLTINSNVKNVLVYIDSKPYGPLKKLTDPPYQLPAGKHTIELRTPEGKWMRGKTTIEPGREKNENFIFK